MGKSAVLALEVGPNDRLVLQATSGIDPTSLMTAAKAVTALWSSSSQSKRGAGSLVLCHFQDDGAVHLFVARSEHDDRQRLAAPTQAAASGQAIFTGHHQDKHHQMRRKALDIGAKLGRIGKQERVKTVAAKIGGEQLAQFGVVVDKQYATHCPARRATQVAY